MSKAASSVNACMTLTGQLTLLLWAIWCPEKSMLRQLALHEHMYS